MLLLGPFYQLITVTINLFNLSPKMAIAVAHILFNVLSAILVIGFTKEIESLIKRLIRH